jgi:hypothetical protein
VIEEMLGRQSVSRSRVNLSKVFLRMRCLSVDQTLDALGFLTHNDASENEKKAQNL